MKTLRGKTAFCLILPVILAGCGGEKTGPEQKKEKIPAGAEIPQLTYTIVKKFPHDREAYTEGFLFHGKDLLESTGSPENLPKTRSVIGVVDLVTGKLEVKTELDKKKYFGEGIVCLNNKVYQLTYKNQTGFVYDDQTFKQTGRFVYTNKEGWGMTTDGRSLIFSDGTDVLTWLDPVSFKVLKTLHVSENGYALDYLNELEYIKGYIYANVWQSSGIVKIDPASGKVVAKIILTPLFEEAKHIFPGAELANGIAYDSLNDRILVTGKLWPAIYQVKFDH